MDKTKKRLNKLIVTIALMLLSLLMMANTSRAYYHYRNGQQWYIDNDIQYDLECFAGRKDEFSGLANLVDQNVVTLRSVHRFGRMLNANNHVGVVERNRFCFEYQRNTNDNSLLRLVGTITFGYNNTPNKTYSEFKNNNGANIQSVELNDAKTGIMAYLAYLGQYEQDHNTVVYGTIQKNDETNSELQDIVWDYVTGWYHSNAVDGKVSSLADPSPYGNAVKARWKNLIKIHYNSDGSENGKVTGDAPNYAAYMNTISGYTLSENSSKETAVSTTINNESYIGPFNIGGFGNSSFSSPICNLGTNVKILVGDKKVDVYDKNGNKIEQLSSGEDFYIVNDNITDTTTIKAVLECDYINSKMYFFHGPGREQSELITAGKIAKMKKELILHFTAIQPTYAYTKYISSVTRNGNKIYETSAKNSTEFSNGKFSQLIKVKRNGKYSSGENFTITFNKEQTGKINPNQPTIEVMEDDIVIYTFAVYNSTDGRNYQGTVKFDDQFPDTVSIEGMSDAFKSQSNTSTRNMKVENNKMNIEPKGVRTPWVKVKILKATDLDYSKTIDNWNTKLKVIPKYSYSKSIDKVIVGDLTYTKNDGKWTATSNGKKYTLDKDKDGNPILPENTKQLVYKFTIKNEGKTKIKQDYSGKIYDNEKQTERTSIQIIDTMTGGALSLASNQEKTINGTTVSSGANVTWNKNNTGATGTVTLKADLDSGKTTTAYIICDFDINKYNNSNSSVQNNDVITYLTVSPEKTICGKIDVNGNFISLSKIPKKEDGTPIFFDGEAVVYEFRWTAPKNGRAYLKSISDNYNQESGGRLVYNQNIDFNSTNYNKRNSDWTFENGIATTRNTTVKNSEGIQILGDTKILGTLSSNYTKPSTAMNGGVVTRYLTLQIKLKDGETNATITNWGTKIDVEPKYKYEKKIYSVVIDESRIGGADNVEYGGTTGRAIPNPLPSTTKSITYKFEVTNTGIKTIPAGFNNKAYNETEGTTTDGIVINDEMYKGLLFGSSTITWNKVSEDKEKTTYTAKVDLKSAIEANKTTEVTSVTANFDFDRVQNSRVRNNKIENPVDIEPVKTLAGKIDNDGNFVSVENLMKQEVNGTQYPIIENGDVVVYKFTYTAPKDGDAKCRAINDDFVTQSGGRLSYLQDTGFNTKDSKYKNSQYGWVATANGVTNNAYTNTKLANGETKDIYLMVRLILKDEDKKSLEPIVIRNFNTTFIPRDLTGNKVATEVNGTSPTYKTLNAYAYKAFTSFASAGDRLKGLLERNQGTEFTGVINQLSPAYKDDGYIDTAIKEMKALAGNQETVETIKLAKIKNDIKELCGLLASGETGRNALAEKYNAIATEIREIVPNDSNIRVLSYNEKTGESTKSQEAKLVQVEVGDIITYTIRVGNKLAYQSLGTTVYDLYSTADLEFVETDETNEFGWTKGANGQYYSDWAKTQLIDGHGFVDLKIAFKVKNANNGNITNTVKFERITVPEIVINSNHDEIKYVEGYYRADENGRYNKVVINAQGPTLENIDKSAGTVSVNRSNLVEPVETIKGDIVIYCVTVYNTGKSTLGRGANIVDYVSDSKYLVFNREYSDEGWTEDGLGNYKMETKKDLVEYNGDLNASSDTYRIAFTINAPDGFEDEIANYVAPEHDQPHGTTIIVKKQNVQKFVSKVNENNPIYIYQNSKLYDAYKELERINNNYLGFVKEKSVDYENAKSGLDRVIGYINTATNVDENIDSNTKNALVERVNSIKALLDESSSAKKDEDKVTKLNAAKEAFKTLSSDIYTKLLYQDEISREPAVTSVKHEYILGDVNNDGKVTTRDIDAINNVINNNIVVTKESIPEGFIPELYDVNQDGKVDKEDWEKVHLMTTGQIPTETISMYDFSYSKPSKLVNVQTNDTIIYTIRVYNEKERDNFGERVYDVINSEDLEFVANSNINKHFGWKLDEKGRYYTDCLTIQNASNMTDEIAQGQLTGEGKISGYLNEDGSLNANNYVDLQIEFKVKTTKNGTINNTASIIDFKPTPEDTEPTPVIDKLATKYVKSIEHTYDDGTTKVENVEGREPTISRDANGNLVVQRDTSPVEVRRNDYITYAIRFYNTGTADITGERIYDLLNLTEHHYLEFVRDVGTNNEYGWNVDNEGNVYTDKLVGKTIPGFDGTYHYEEVYITLKVVAPDLYKGVITNYNEPSIIDIDIGGYVWTDTSTGKGQVDNGLKDDVENFMQGVKVELFEKQQDGTYKLIRTATTDANGKYYFEKLDNEKEYVVEFTYNGMKYSPTTLLANTQHDGDKVESVPGVTKLATIPADYYRNSKATEELKSANNRDEFNRKFETITTGKAEGIKGSIGLQYEESDNEQNATHVSKVRYNDEFAITSKSVRLNTCATGDMSDAEKLQVETNYLHYINLGLIERPDFDLELIEDVDKVTVSVNGVTGVYNGNKVTVRTSDLSTIGNDVTYEQGLRDAEVNSDSKGLAQDKQLKIYMTYVTKITNSSEGIVNGIVKQVALYADSKLGNITECYVKTSPNDESKQNASYEDYTNPNVSGLSAKLVNLPEMEITNGSTIYLYTTYEVNTRDVVELLKNKDKATIKAYSEIVSYSTKYTDGKVAGLIDVDSAPGNLDLNGGRSYYEDDELGAPGYVFMNEDARKLSGIAFDDHTEVGNDNVRQGNGEYNDADGDKLIAGVIVELHEINDDGTVSNDTAKVWNGSSWVNGETSTDENGNYTFSGFLPGNYVVRFKYGTDERTVLKKANGGLNEESYNGYEYKTTIRKTTIKDNYWYKNEQDKRYSDAVDNVARRDEVNNNAYSKINNANANKLLSFRTATSVDQVKDIIDKTWMFADTNAMRLELEEEAIELNSDGSVNNVNALSSGTYTYEINNVDMGLALRPSTKLEVQKIISNVVVKDSAGNTILDADISDDVDATTGIPKITFKSGTPSMIQTVRSTKKASDINSTNPKEQSESYLRVCLDDELIKEASLQITYKIKITNNSEKNYSAEEIITTIGKVADYASTPSSLVLNEQDNKNADGSAKWIEVTKSNVQDLVAQGLIAQSVADNISNNTKIMISTDNNGLSKDVKSGESVTETLVLSTTLDTTSGNADLDYRNITEILEFTNKEGILTLRFIPGNQEPEAEKIVEPDSDMAERLTITGPEGANESNTIYIVIGTSLAVLAAGIVIIKVFVLKRKD